jgi:hypothetical protein
MSGIAAFGLAAALNCHFSFRLNEWHGLPRFNHADRLSVANLDNIAPVLRKIRTNTRHKQCDFHDTAFANWFI